MGTSSFIGNQMVNTGYHNVLLTGTKNDHLYWIKDYCNSAVQLSDNVFSNSVGISKRNLSKCVPVSSTSWELHVCWYCWALCFIILADPILPLIINRHGFYPMITLRFTNGPPPLAPLQVRSVSRLMFCYIWQYVHKSWYFIITFVKIISQNLKSKRLVRIRTTQFLIQNMSD